MCFGNIFREFFTILFCVALKTVWPRNLPSNPFVRGPRPTNGSFSVQPITGLVGQSEAHTEKKKYEARLGLGPPTHRLWDPHLLKKRRSWVPLPPVVENRSTNLAAKIPIIFLSSHCHNSQGSPFSHGGGGGGWRGRCRRRQQRGRPTAHLRGRAGGERGRGRPGGPVRLRRARRRRGVRAHKRPQLRLRRLPLPQ